MLGLLGNTSPQLKLISLDISSITDEGNWRLPKRLEKSISLWAIVSEQPKQ